MQIFPAFLREPLLQTVILTTAKPPRAIYDFYLALNLSSPLVCFNGALIFKDLDSTQNLSALQSVNIAPEFIEQVYTIALGYKVKIGFYNSGEWITDCYDD